MIAGKILKRFNAFGQNRHGGVPVQMALVFGAAGILAAVLMTPLLQESAQRYAGNDGYGVDQTLTGSIGPGQRYTIRKSVLSPEPEIFCGPSSSSSCGKARR
jgi:hypothetical protein